jgi:hypothetical protein
MNAPPLICWRASGRAAAAEIFYNFDLIAGGAYLLVIQPMTHIFGEARFNLPC